MVVATTASLGGVTGATATAAAQETDPLAGEDVSMSLRGVTMSFGRARLAYEDGRLRFRGRDWSIEGRGSTLTGDRAQVRIDDVSEEAFARLRTAMADAIEAESVVPLAVGIAEADIDSDASVRVSAGSVRRDGRRFADQIVATGTYGEVLPDGLQEVSRGLLLTDAGSVGASEWEEVTVERGETQLAVAPVEISPRETDGSVGGTEFTLAVGEVTRNGDQVVSDFETSGTLAELLAALPTTGAPEVDDEGLPKSVVVSSDTDAYNDYVFEVTGDLSYPSGGEDTGRAADEIIRSGDRVRVEGTVSYGEDRYFFSGDLIEVDVPDAVELTISER